jgi:uncharacterized protein YggL (DUF469 family)
MSNITITLAALVSSNHWLSVSHILLNLYPGSQLRDYEDVYNQLQFIVPEPTEIELVLTLVEESGEKPYVDVSGRSLGPLLDELTSSHALEFTPWAEWLGMPIAHDTLQHFTELEILAHCLWEMTFIGYDEESIQKEMQQLIAQIEELKANKQEHEPGYSEKEVPVSLSFTNTLTIEEADTCFDLFIDEIERYKLYFGGSSGTQGIEGVVDFSDSGKNLSEVQALLQAFAATHTQWVKGIKFL